MGKILAEVRVAGEVQQYKVVSIGGKRTNKLFGAEKGPNLNVYDEFAGLLRNTFDTSVRFHLYGVATANRKLSHVFKVTVPKGIGHLIHFGGKMIDPNGVGPRIQIGGSGGPVAWDGFVYIDRESEHALAICLRAVNIPRSYGVRQVHLSVFYGNVKIDGKYYLLPVASEALSVMPGAIPIYRQSSRYRNYRKFEAESNVQFEHVESNVSFPRPPHP